MKYKQFEVGEELYNNPLASEKDLRDWRLEGQAKISFSEDRLVLENLLDPSTGDDANWVYWCTKKFPDNIIVEWEFWPIREPGLCMLFFSAKGQGGKDIFDPSLTTRDGKYPQYHSGDINALHLSYFRHRRPETRAFRTVNLRKSRGFHMVAQGACPMPPANEAISPYHMKVVKYKEIVQLSIQDFPILEWEDDGESYGPLLGEGNIGLRQMAPMKGGYSNLKVSQAIEKYK